MKESSSTTTKQILLKNSLKLFAKQGFDKTSIQQIIDKSKVSKGAFYHYFSSKDDILDTIAELFVLKIISMTEDVVNKKDMSALEKLNYLIINVSLFKINNKKERTVLHKAVNKDSNLKLKQKIINRSIELSRKPLYKLFEQGAREGVFDTEYKKELADFYVPLAVAFRKSFLDFDLESTIRSKDGKDKIKKGLMFFEDLLERIFGIKKGSLIYSKTLIKELKL